MFHSTLNYPKAYKDIYQDCQNILTLLNQHKDQLHLSSKRIQSITLPEDLSNIHEVYVKLKSFQNVINKIEPTLSAQETSTKILQENTPLILLDYSIQRCTPLLQDFIKKVESQSPHLKSYDAKLEELFKAIENKDSELVKELIEENKSLIHSINVDGLGPLHFCAAKGDVETLSILIKNFGANINQRTSDLYTPALLAAQESNIPCLIELAKQGANLTARNLYGKDVISFLAENKPELKTMIEDHPDANFYLEQEGGCLKITGEEFVSNDHIKYCIEVS